MSCYYHPVYEPLIKAGWKKIDYETVSFAVGRTRHTGVLGKGSALKKAKRIETVLISPKAFKEMRKQSKQLTLFSL